MFKIDMNHKGSTLKLNEFKWYGKHLENQFTYNLDISNPNNPSDVWARVWLFGTGRANCYGLGGMDCIRRDQLEWFKQESAKIPKDDPARENGIAFMHHALQEHMMLVNDYTVYGQKRDYSTCQGLNTGAFAHFKQSGTIKWVSAGGDHSTDFWGTYAGIGLSYGRKTGGGSYGPKFKETGGRVFELTFDENTRKVDISTYIFDKNSEKDDQKNQARLPQGFSWLKSDHCVGSEDVFSLFSKTINADDYWVPEFIS